ncbi:MAG: glutamyl-tRNA reductase [Desulfobacterales bacterium]|jgi:glutamyl-tRNA reductase|nr:glutamyl-tRNA reductase [Desulfobacterales bacterium]
MHDIVLIGINHKTAPVELRECIAFSAEEAETAVAALRRLPAVVESLLYSTCNRVELLMVSADPPASVEAAKAFIAEFNKIPREQFENALYVHENENAARHLFRVAASLDSMILGEPQILGQIKEAYRQAAAAKTTGVILNRLLHRTFFVAKRIRTETGIGDRAVSISYAAVEMARKIFGTLEGKRVLLIGAGEMAELAVEHLLRHAVGETFVANRTFENGLTLANRFRGRAIRFEEIAEHLKQADIIISSTGAPGFVVTREQVRSVARARRNRPLFFIDIAVPRDIDPEINRLDNAYVYDIDDLKGVVEENIGDRQKEALKGERIIDEAVVRFRNWHQSLDVVPTIVSLRQKMEAIAESEIRRTLHGSSLPPESAPALSRMMGAFINKVLHEPTVFLKQDGMHANKPTYLDAVRKLFKLDE